MIERKWLSNNPNVLTSAHRAWQVLRDTRQRPTQVWWHGVCGLLLFGILVQLAAIARPLLPASRAHASADYSARPQSIEPPGRALDVPAIVGAHLFGTVTDAGASLDRSDRPLILVATIASTDPAKGMAVLKHDPAGPGHLYLVGAQLPGDGGVLHEVRNGSIVLDREGRLETVAFARPAHPLNLAGLGVAVAADESMLAQVNSGGAGTEPVTEVVLQQRAEAAERGEQIDTAVPGALPRENPEPGH